MPFNEAIEVKLGLFAEDDFVHKIYLDFLLFSDPIQSWLYIVRWQELLVNRIV